ncbi:hypothetical protein KRX57_01590 [Weeksellaceae bacterium TAE3-ERU29]|nr:hypothetical protein [Weeksellaceae bacterium TAE3-ERU29]
MDIQVEEILNIYKGDKLNLKEYLQKHWLSREEYIQEWLPFKDIIFNNTFKCFPDMVFNKSYVLRPLFSGAVLIEEDYSAYLKILKYFNQTEYVIIRDSVDYMGFKFNVNESWNDIFNPNSNFLMSELFCFADNFYLFDKSGCWGKYSSNDDSDFIDIIGFLPKFIHIFRENLIISDEDKEIIMTELPEYKELIIW